MLGFEHRVSYGCRLGEVCQGFCGDFCGSFGFFFCSKERAVAVVVIGSGIEERGLLSANRHGQPFVECVEVDEIAKNMAADGEKERVPAAFETFEKVGAAKSDQSFPGP